MREAAAEPAVVLKVWKAWAVIAPGYKPVVHESRKDAYEDAAVVMDDMGRLGAKGHPRVTRVEVREIARSAHLARGA